MKELPYPYPRFEDLEIFYWMSDKDVYIGDWYISLRIRKMERTSLAPSSTQEVLGDFDKTFEKINDIDV